MDENNKSPENLSESEEAQILTEIEEITQNRPSDDASRPAEDENCAQNQNEILKDTADTDISDDKSPSQSSDETENKAIEGDDFSSSDSTPENDETSDIEPEEEIFEETNVFADESSEDDPQKEKSFFKKHLKALVITGAVIVVIIAAYIALCFTVKNQDTILNNISVEGFSVSGLSLTEASDALCEEFAYTISDYSVDISVLDETITVSLENVLDIDWDALAVSCYNVGHKNFITGGWYWIKSQFAETEISFSPFAAYEDQLQSALEESGLTSLTSVVETTWEITDEEIIFTMGSSGQIADTEALSLLILTAIENADYDTVIECPMTDVSPSDIDLDSIYEEIYTEPENATLDPDNDYAIVESKEGVSFDLDEAASLLENAADGDTVSVELVYTQPDIDTETLEANLFADTLGTYTTTVSGTSARRTNVKLASAACEVILLPGETFSYNETVGERTTAKGYQAASAYSNGATVQTIGGGVCQVSSTLYVACLYANLEIVERHAHSYASSYMPLGWDATVSWGTLDFQFTNSTNYPIRIVATYSSSNKLTMTILGTDETGYTVKIVSQTYSTTAYETETIEDDTLEEGKTVVEQSGYTGYTVQTWRYVYDADGNLISDDEEAYSAYKKRNKIVRVGTKTDDEDEEEETAEEDTESSDDE